jgi:hypothetical protein
VVISSIWPHRHTAESERLVWRSPWDALRSDETSWRGLGDFRLLAAVVFFSMIALYYAFAGEASYYPIHGTVTRGGQPVADVTVHLDTEDDTFDAQVTTDADGQFAYGTAGRAGGAPAGTEYRVRVGDRVIPLTVKDEVNELAIELP